MRLLAWTVCARRLAFIALAALPALAATAEAATPTRILCLGDSITQGVGGHTSYRYPLWKDLVDSGVTFDLVGQMNNPYSGPTTYPAYKGLAFDTNHEGHYGWTVDQVLNGGVNNGGTYGSGTGKLSTWLSGYTADIALVHLGTNDVGIWHYTPTATVVGYLNQVIDTLRTGNPNVTIFLAEVLPNSNATWNSAINNLNAQIPGIVTAKSTTQSKVYLVDQNTGFGLTTDYLYDGTHPSASTEIAMADRWMGAMESAGVLPEPATLSLLALGGLALLRGSWRSGCNVGGPGRSRPPGLRVRAARPPGGRGSA
jgi:lysophospholipase L1-like esterase